jgi:dihydrofolate synthase / folylpolyglutamate synthase
MIPPSFNGYSTATMRMDNVQVASCWQALCKKNVWHSMTASDEASAAISIAGGRTKPIVITVGGTNGKGSTCAMLEAILVASGFQVGCYTSPYFFELGEAIRLNGAAANANQLQAARELLDEIEGSVQLSPFEIDTLIAMASFSQASLDVWILEVGMGGRTDAVNIVDSDCAILTCVALDHQAWLGNDREAIGHEKAHIFRAGKPAICADPQPPESVLKFAAGIGADLWLFGRDFNYSGDKLQWAYGGRVTRRHSMSYPALRGTNQLLNASAALAALETLKSALPVTQQAVRQGLSVVDLPGRFHVLPGRPTIVLDVAHNPHAAGHLAANLDQMGFFPFTYGVLGMLKDKDIAGVIYPMRDKVDHWILTDTTGARGASAQQLAEVVRSIWKQSGFVENAERTITLVATAAQGLAEAKIRATENDRIVVFGSFLTVAQCIGKYGSR